MSISGVFSVIVTDIGFLALLQRKQQGLRAVITAYCCIKTQINQEKKEGLERPCVGFPHHGPHPKQSVSSPNVLKKKKLVDGCQHFHR